MSTTAKGGEHQFLRQRRVNIPIQQVECFDDDDMLENGWYGR
jgi:hypothetical protein